MDTPISKRTDVHAGTNGHDGHENGNANGNANGNGVHATPVTKKPSLDFGAAWDYAPAPEARDHAKIQPRYELFIGGQWHAPKSGTYFPTINPSDETTLSEVADANEADVDLAVQAARKAYDTVWSKMRGSERAKYIFRIARALQEKSRELAVVETLDGGKPIKESRDVDLPLAASHFFLPRGLGGQARLRVPRTYGASARRRGGRSFRGTSRCSWPRGRSRRRWRAETPWSSSRPRRRR